MQEPCSGPANGSNAVVVLRGNAMPKHRLTSAVAAGLLIAFVATQASATSDPKTALAPTGKLRVAFLLGPIYATRNSATGELKGVAIDLGQELARRIGVAFEPVGFVSLPEVIAGAKTGAWDVALMGINAERAEAMDFSPPYLEVEQGYLVRAGVAITTEADVDKAGIRVGVIEKAGSDILLSKTLKSAVLIRTATVPELSALLDSGTVDAIAATKVALFAAAGSRPGSRVLDGRILVEPIGMAVPKGRDAAAAAYVGQFVGDVKMDGLVKAAIERAGLRGVVVSSD
jgi:polar amino acid transport system substrate-binding protein